MEDSIGSNYLARQSILFEGEWKNLFPVGAGFADTKFESYPGAVVVSVYQGDSEVLHFATPEKITLHPLRTDRLTYSYSSEYNNFYKNILK